MCMGLRLIKEWGHSHGIEGSADDTLKGCSEVKYGERGKIYDMVLKETERRVQDDHCFK